MATYPLWGVVHGESVPDFFAKEFLPLNKSDNILAKVAAESGPLRPQRVASSSPLKCHMGFPRYWSGCTPRLMRIAMTSTIVSPALASNFILFIRRYISLVSSS